MEARFQDALKQLDQSERLVALILGLIFFGIGILGFIPGFVWMPDVASEGPMAVQSLRFSDGYGNLFGLFPTNYLHNAVHIVVGLLGIAAATSFSGSLVYNRLFAVSYTLIAIMGLLPGANMTFGIMPIAGNNVWFNALTAALAGYFGFFKPAEISKIGPSASV